MTSQEEADILLAEHQARRRVGQCIDEAIAELGAALMQTIASDDQIIMNHIRVAHTMLVTLRRVVPSHTIDLLPMQPLGLNR